jgi:large subunit ribosomal protein L28
MARVCEICQKKPLAGRRIARRGIAKRSGGIGLKITGVSIRRFLPNLQTVRAFVNGGVRRMSVCVKCLKAGKIQKAPKRAVPAKAA